MYERGKEGEEQGCGQDVAYRMHEEKVSLIDSIDEVEMSEEQYEI